MGMKLWSRLAVSATVFAVAAGVFVSPATSAMLGDIDVSGYVDVYGAVNLNQPAALAIPLHPFEGADFSASLNRLELVFDHSAWRVDLGYGAADAVTQGAAPVPILNIQQGYIKWPLTWMGRDVAVDIGKFVTSLGFEVIESKDNWMYSRGLLFQFAIPYWHVGGRATTSINDNWWVQGSLLNGWQLNTSASRALAIGAQVGGTPMKNLTTILNYINGPSAGAGVTANVLDLVAIYDVNPALSLGLNFDTGTQGGLAYSAFAVYGKYGLPTGTVVGRFESWSNTGTGLALLAGTTSVSSITIGYDMPLQENTTGRVEYRLDSGSPGTPFATSGVASASQSVITAGVVTSF